MATEEAEVINLKDFVKGQASMKGQNLTKIAEKLDKRQSSLSGVLIRGKMKLQTLIDILDVLDEEFILVLKNGQKFNIKI